MARILKAEMWDKMQYLFRNYYDCTVHSVFYLEDKIDENMIGEIFMGFLKKVPVLRSTWIDRFSKPYWKVNKKYSLADFFEVVETSDEEKSLNEFITQPIDMYGKIQLKVKIFRTEKRDILAMLSNHMCFDGGDLSYITKKLVENYNNYKQTGKLVVDVKQGTRSADQIYMDMTFREKVKAKLLFKNVSEVKGKTTFPYTKASELDIPRLVLHKVDSSVFNAVRAKGKEMGAKLNDVFLAAYYRALFDICTIDPEADYSITIPSMINLRKFFIDKDTLGLTNMTGFMLCNIKNDPSDNMTATVKKVMDALAPVKADEYNGLYSLPLLKLAYGILPQRFSELAIMQGYQNPLIAMSNIGPIDPKNYIFGGVKLTDAWFSGAIKYKPYIQLALTTFNGNITFSVGSKCNDEDEKNIRAMLSNIEKYLKMYAQE